MGAWSHEPFGNDTANDWAYDLEETKDMSHIEAALDNVIEQGADYLEASNAEEAVGAIEVLAKLLGHGTQSDAYTEKVDVWVKSINQKPSPALLQKARQVIERILAKDSELLELWQDSKDLKEWQGSMAKLLEAVHV
jgi:hypothetical protein